MSVWMDQLEHKYLLPAVQWLPQASCFKRISLSQEFASVCFKRHHSLFCEKILLLRQRRAWTSCRCICRTVAIQDSTWLCFYFLWIHALLSLPACSGSLQYIFFSNHEATHLQATKLRYKSKTGYFTGLINRFLLHCYSMTSPQRFNLLTSI